MAAIGHLVAVDYTLAAISAKVRSVARTSINSKLLKRNSNSNVARIGVLLCAF
jgi:hypothetical protein